MRSHLNCSGGRIGKLWWTNSLLVPVSSHELGIDALNHFSRRWVLWGRIGWGDGAGWALGSVRSER